MENKKPTYDQLANLKHDKWISYGYEMAYWSDYDYSHLYDIITGYQRHGNQTQTYNDIIIMADTETSKSPEPDNDENHIVAWTISARAYNCNLFTLWGQKPTHMIECMTRLAQNMHGHTTIFFWHNLSYDWQFIKKFCFDKWGYPIHQLNTKPLYPINIEFENGITFHDSLILAQRSLEKWAVDMAVEHQKAVGFWNYDKIRNQNTQLTIDELIYIEHDTLAGVECLDAMRIQLNKKSWQLPFTATGIVREDIYKLGKLNRAKDRFYRAVPTFEQYLKLEFCFHGGFVHANRDEIGFINPAECYDIASSYPFVMLSEKLPCERFTHIPDCKIDNIFRQSSDYAFMFKLVLVKPQLKSENIVMPALQFSKCVKSINAILDNGRVLTADYIEIYLTDIDAQIIMQQYDYLAHICVDVWTARKDYLPRWLTDYIYNLFVQKCQLKGGDPVAYSIAKSRINSIYGLTVQHSIRDNILEDYATGEYDKETVDMSEEYEKYIKRQSSILLYSWGVFITSYAFRNLFELGYCVSKDGLWLYSDTDSCYCTEWDMNKIEQYNNVRKEKLINRGYGAVTVNNKQYWLGIAEFDGKYSEFVAMGAKRYACRYADSGELKITVAGVPKKTGVKCLNNDIRNFKRGLVFDGETTGKLTHEYIHADDIHHDSAGNEIGDSINLYPCDYLLDAVDCVDWDFIDYEEIEMQIYE